METRRLVLIEWEDAAGMPSDLTGGWQTLVDIETNCQPVIIRSVGWLIVSTKQRVVIVPNLSEDKYGDSPTAIPRKWVKRIVDLTEKTV